MKRWSKLILVAAIIMAIIVGGAIAWLVLGKNKPVSFNRLAAADAVDQEARAKYQEKLRAAAMKAAEEVAAKAAAVAQAKQTVTTASVQPTGQGKLVTYSVAVKGSPLSDLSEFRNQAAETLNDTRGWPRAGVYFREVPSGGDFTLWLSEASLVPSFSPSICSTVYSCSIGRNVIINDERWRHASDSWNAAGGGLRDYRHMVINHEVGHFLGHRDNELVCAGPGQLAPLMQQQSINLRGCTFNPWPLDKELWTNR